MVTVFDFIVIER